RRSRERAPAWPLPDSGPGPTRATGRGEWGRSPTCRVRRQVGDLPHSPQPSQFFPRRGNPMQTPDSPARPAAPPQGCPVWRGLCRAVHAPWFAYLTIALLPLHVIWGAWDYRDLTSGDTASYYTIAHGWATELTDNFVWSPLYTVYYG